MNEWLTGRIPVSGETGADSGRAGPETQPVSRSCLWTTLTSEPYKLCSQQTARPGLQTLPYPRRNMWSSEKLEKLADFPRPRFQTQQSALMAASGEPPAPPIQLHLGGVLLKVACWSPKNSQWTESTKEQPASRRRWHRLACLNFSRLYCEISCYRWVCKKYVLLNSTQLSVMTYIGKESEKECIYANV